MPLLEHSILTLRLELSLAPILVTIFISSLLGRSPKQTTFYLGPGRRLRNWGYETDPSCDDSCEILAFCGSLAKILKPGHHKFTFLETTLQIESLCKYVVPRSEELQSRKWMCLGSLGESALPLEGSKTPTGGLFPILHWRPAFTRLSPGLLQPGAPHGLTRQPKFLRKSLGGASFQKSRNTVGLLLSNWFS